VPPSAKVKTELVLGLGGGVHTTTGGYTVINYRLVEDRIRELREARRPVPDYLKHLLQTLRPEAAFVMLTVSPHGHEDAQPSPPRQAVMPEEVIDTKAVAALLGVTERTARRKAPELGGRQVAGRWLFDPMIVATLAERRTTA
jgi:hypothetical protein